MKATVNETCIACGLCAGICPEIFSLNDGIAQGSVFGDELLPEAQEARDSCPVSAISIDA